MDSIRRFGTAMEAGLAGRADIDLQPLRMRASAGAGPDPVGRVWRNIDEFARFPAMVSARPVETDVFHVTDSAHAHVLSRLPPLRTVVSCHDVRELRVREVDPQTAVSDRLLRLRLRVHLRGLATAAAVVCSSAAAGRDIAQLTGVAPRRIAVIPKGVGDEFVALPAAVRARVRGELVEGG